MQLKKSFFNRQLIRSDWKHYWPLLFGCVFIMFFAFPLNLWNISTRKWYFENAPMQMLGMIKEGITAGAASAIVIGVIWGIFSAMILYGYLMKNNSTGMIFSLPIRREAQYNSHILFGIEMFTLTNIFIFFCAVIVLAINATVLWRELLIWFLIAELSELFFFVFGVVCTQMTGWMLAAPVIYAGLNSFVIILHALISMIASMYYRGWNRGIVGDSSFVKWLTPCVKMMSAVLDTEGNLPKEMLEEAWEKLVITFAVYAVVTVLMYLFGKWMYKNRAAEKAGDAIVFNWLKPIALYIISVCGALGLGLLMYTIVGANSMILLLVFEIIYGLICYAAVTMMMEKSFRIISKKNIAGACILIAGLIVLMILIRVDIFGYQKYVPATDKVENVSVQVDAYNSSITSDPEFLQNAVLLHAAILAEDDAEENGSYVRINYLMKNGKTVDRWYFVDIENNEQIAQSIYNLINCPEGRSNLAQKMVSNLGDGKYVGGTFFCNSFGGEKETTKMLSPDEIMKIYEAVQKDAKEYGTIEMKDLAYLDAWFQFDVMLADGTFRDFYYFEIRPDDVNTIEVMIDLGLISSVEEVLGTERVK